MENKEIENKRELFFRAELVKDKSEFKVIVPENLAKELGLKDKDLVGVTIKKSGLITVPKTLVDVYKKYMPELSNLTEDQFSEILDLHNREKVSKDRKKITKELEMLSHTMLGYYNTFKQRLLKIDKELLKKELADASGKL